MVTTNDRLRAEVGWEPTYHGGLAQVIETWKNDGALREKGDGYVWAGD